MRLLLVEDDKNLRDTMREILHKTYIVDVAGNGEEGEYLAFINDYDLIILDIILPDLSGIRVCQQIRKNNIRTPVLFLTARKTVKTLVKALDAGGDDYLMKPFRREELLARIRALLRRESCNRSSAYCIGELTIDSMARDVCIRGKHVYLRRKEFDLLEYLIRNSNRTVSRSMILEHVWEKGIDSISNTVDVHIKHLREKVERELGCNVIKTVHGLGYSFAYMNNKKGGDKSEPHNKKNTYR